MIRRRTLPFIGAVALLVALAAPSAFAAAKTAVGTISPSSVPAGATSDYTFTLAPTSGSIGSFDLTAPSGWTILSLSSPPAGVTNPSSSVISGRGVGIGSSSPLTVAFSAQAPCAAASTGWTLVAKSGTNFTGSSFAVDPSSSLSTSLDGTCLASFVAGRGPADAAFNGGSTSENITSVAYTPTGDPVQVVVTDFGGTPRPGVSITLELRCSPPDSTCAPPASAANLTGSVTATSGAGGLAAFDPISVDAVGLNYRLEPTGSGVAGTASDPFGIYEEGNVNGDPVHGSSADHKIDATVSADTPSGSLSVLVSEVGLDCGSSIPTDYVYRPLSSSVVAWKYTGTGSQTISVLVDKSLLKFVDKGSAHLDFCYLVEGLDSLGNPKTFTDKFGNVTSGPALLPDCSPTISQNCIVSETAAQGGDRLVTVTVEDGRGKI